MNVVKLDLPDADRMEKFADFDFLRFAFAKKVGNGRYEQVSAWKSCREGVCAQAKKAITGEWKKTPYTDSSGEINFKSMLLLVYNKKSANAKANAKARDKRMNRYMKGALNLLNFFEKMGHLKRSKVYVGRHSLSATNRIYLFEGSGEWMRSTHLISLYTLLIRCGGYREFEKEIKSFAGFLKTLKSLYADWKVNGGRTRGRYHHWPLSSKEDVSYLKNIGPKLKALMEQRKRIFSGKRKAEHYRSTAHNSDGIAQFVYGTVDDKEVQKRFVASCDKYEIKEIAK